MTYKRIVTVTLNPAIDTSIWVQELVDQQVCRPQKETRQAGGKGVNISRTLKQFGVDAPAYFLCGEQRSEDYLHLLKQEDIRCQYVPVPGAVRENLHIVTEEGKFYKINRSGPKADTRRLHMLARMIRNGCDGSTILALSGSLPKGLDVEELFTFMQEISQRVGCLVVDTAALSIQQLCRVHPFLIKPNLEEFCSMTGEKHLSREQAIQLAQWYAQRGIDQILLSFGSEGLAWVTQDRALWADAPKVRAVNTVGAGDNALAGFLLGLLESKTPQQCLKQATAFGSASVLLDGTHPPRKEDVEGLLHRVFIRGCQP